MKYFLLTIDLEEFIPEEFGIKEKLDGLEISKLGITRLIDLLRDNKIKATFFITLKFANAYPEIIKELIKEGHEIGLHAYSHDHRYDKMPEKEVYYYLKKAKDEIERKFKIKLNGFRAPQMSTPNPKILKELGIKYDSSLHPTYIPGKYNNFSKKRRIMLKDNFIILPISVTPLLRLPFSWLWFRTLGLNYSKICTLWTLTDQNYINIYFHPWDFSDFNKNYILLRNTGLKALINLDEYLKWCNKNNLKFDTISNYLKNERNQTF